MTNKLVSCICLTYKRAPTAQILLEETIQSFLNQDYTDKELLVINDAAEHDLVLDQPYNNITILNIKRRFRTLGEKYNAAIALAKGDYIAPFEDDDLSFPWRLSMSMKNLTLSGAEYYNPKRYWFWDGKYHFNHPMGYAHNASMFTRAAFIKVRGYDCLSGPQDAIMDTTLLKKVKSLIGSHDNKELPRKDWFYIYRWNTGSYHLSGVSNTQSYYDSLSKAAIKTAQVILKPRWRADYVNDVRKLLNK
jgi:glycosyltransferase involved in cell wall biosynthesis